MKKKKKKRIYSESEIREMERELRETAMDFLDAIYNRSDNYIIENIYRKFNTDWEIINKKIVMKEKSCLSCKNMLFPRKCLDICGETRMCSKNNLFIERPQSHSCNMHEENYGDVCSNCKWFISGAVIQNGIPFNLASLCNVHSVAFKITYPNIQSCKLFEKK